MTPLLLYLDQNYLSGIAKHKPSFRELAPTLRSAVSRGLIAVPESSAHVIESAPRPDLGLLELLRSHSGGLRLADQVGPLEHGIAHKLRTTLARDLPERRDRASDAIDIEALSRALPRCQLITCDALMADVVKRAGLNVRFGCELYTGRRADVERLRVRIEQIMAQGTT